MKLKFIVCFLLMASLAQAASAPEIRTGYDRLYQGDVTGALEHFQTLSTREPQNLAASFGVLMALDERGLQDPAFQKEFEQRIELVIQTAGTRYEKNKQDAEALFYLAQGYLRRGQYRF